MAYSVTEGGPLLSVSLRRDDPAAPFAPPRASPLSLPLREITFADLNADSVLDLIAIGADTRTDLLLGGAPSRVPNGVYGAGMLAAGSCQTAAFAYGASVLPAQNGDAVILQRPCDDPAPFSRLSSAFPPSDISYETAVQSAFGSFSNDLGSETRALDLDFDGQTDVGWNSGALRGEGSGALSFPPLALDEPWPGDVQLVELSPPVGTVRLWRNDLDAVYELRTTAWWAERIYGSLPYPPGSSIISAATSCDLNGDGLRDLVVSTRDTTQPDGNEWLWLATAPAEFLAPIALSVPDTSRLVRCGDLDRDGREDLIFRPDLSSSEGYVYLGQTSGAPVAVTPTVDTGETFALFDATGDGFLDIFAVTDRVALLEGQGDGTFGSPTMLIEAIPTGVAVGDANLDGAMDVLIAGARPSAPTAVAQEVLLLGSTTGGLANGTFDTLGPLTDPPLSNRGPALLADFNDDGLLDPGWGTGDRRVFLSPAQENATGRVASRSVALSGQPGNGPNSWVPPAEPVVRRDVDGISLPRPTISQRPASFAAYNGATDLIVDLQRHLARDRRLVAAATPLEVVGDVQVRWDPSSVGSRVPRKRVSYRPELGVSDEIDIDTSVVNWTFEVPLFAFAADGASLRVFRLTPDWRRATDAADDPASDTANEGVLPQVADRLGDSRNVIARSDRWSELPATDVRVLAAGTPDARLRISTDRLGIFVVARALD